VDRGVEVTQPLMVGFRFYRQSSCKAAAVSSTDYSYIPHRTESVWLNRR